MPQTLVNTDVMKAGKPIVVIDDSAAVREYFEQVAKKAEIECRVFESAEDSMAYLDSHAPGLIFLDIIMPDKDGLTFLQELRRHPRHEHTPVVVVSSKDYAQDRMTAKELGVLDFVAKPVGTQAIRDLILKHRDPDEKTG